MKSKYLVMSLALFALSACEEPTPVEYTQACTEAYDSKLIQTTGYLSDGGSLFCSNTRQSSTLECGFQLLAKAGDKKSLKVDIAVGNGSNQVEKIQSGYKAEDLKVHHAEGGLVDFKKPVTVTAKARVWKDPTSKESTSCYFTVRKIEQKS